MPQKQRKPKAKPKTAAKPLRQDAPLPRGYAGVYRADDGKRWEAYVSNPDVPGKDGLIRIGVFNTPRQAAKARADWAKRGTA
jgi:hypothetical protein